YSVIDFCRFFAYHCFFIAAISAISLVFRTSKRLVILFIAASVTCAIGHLLLEQYIRFILDLY
ncbi:MAG TPA: hypothetical protein VF719_08925, partial [Abditibacteriaceae bacterium]